jgi:hypothetical protein
VRVGAVHREEDESGCTLMRQKQVAEISFERAELEKKTKFGQKALKKWRLTGRSLPKVVTPCATCGDFAQHLFTNVVSASSMSELTSKVERRKSGVDTCLTTKTKLQIFFATDLPGSGVEDDKLRFKFFVPPLPSKNLK